MIKQPFSRKFDEQDFHAHRGVYEYIAGLQGEITTFRVYQVLSRKDRRYTKDRIRRTLATLSSIYYPGQLIRIKRGVYQWKNT